MPHQVVVIAPTAGVAEEFGDDYILHDFMPDADNVCIDDCTEKVAIDLVGAITCPHCGINAMASAIEEPECDCCNTEDSFVADQDGGCAKCGHDSEKHYDPIRAMHQKAENANDLEFETPLGIALDDNPSDLD